jgi:hypothetical protein
MARETLNEETPTKIVDVFVFGLIMSEVLTGQSVFPKDANPMELSRLQLAGFRPAIRETILNCGPALLDFKMTFPLEIQGNVNMVDRGAGRCGASPRLLELQKISDPTAARVVFHRMAQIGLDVEMGGWFALLPGGVIVSQFRAFQNHHLFFSEELTELHFPAEKWSTLCSA